MEITVTEGLITLAIALVGWNLRETYRLNGTINRLEVKYDALADKVRVIELKHKED